MSEQGSGLDRVVTVISGKGGVLKTSIVANVGGWMALAGLRVLLVDVDVSGNLAPDLGVPDDRLDQGKGLVDGVWYGTALPVLRDVRPRLDVVQGGRGLELLGQMSRSASADDLQEGSVPQAFRARLGELDAAEQYDLVLIDTPPGNGELQDMALAAARWVVVPTLTDQRSLDALRLVGPRVKRARQDNPQLNYLGVVITRHKPAAERVYANVVEQLAAVADTLPRFSTFIRESEAAAHDCRRRSQLAHEVGTDAATLTSQRLQALSARRGAGNVITLPSALSSVADSLGADYQALTQEIVDRISRAEQPPAAQAGGHHG